MPKPENGRPIFWFWPLIVVAAAFIFLAMYLMKVLPDANKQVAISAAELYAAINEDRVEEMGIYPENGTVEGIFTDGRQFATSVASVEELERVVVAKKVSYHILRTSPWTTILIGFLPWLLFLIIMYLLFFKPIAGQSKSGGGIFNFTKSKVDFIASRRIDVTLADVAGCEEAKKEMKDILDFLDNPGPYKRFGIQPPRGVLLIGPPGCGKTMLAKAMAKEVGVPFGYLSGADFVEMFVGVGAARVRDMFAQVFEQARQHGTCILFIDEIDAIGRKRGTNTAGGHEEREQTLNALLAEMDGFDSRSGVIIIGATNRPEILDEALMRPGRFDRKVIISSPDLKGREEVLKVHAKKVPMEPDVNLREIAQATTSLSGAQLANIVKESVIFAIRYQHEKVTRDDICEALDKEIMGQQRNLEIQEEEKKRVSYHEAGHTLAVRYVEGAEPLYKVTILPRGLSLGATYQLPEYDRHVVTKEYLMTQITVAMGGRAAEILKFKQMSTGAQSDFAHATGVAADMVCKYGMSKEIGMAVYERSEDWFGGNGRLNCSPETQAQIDAEIKFLLDAGYKEATRILNEHQDELDALAKALMEKEKLDAREIEEILKNCSKSAS